MKNKHCLLTTLCCILLATGYAQKQRKVSTYLLAQYNKTLTDATKGNNPWGAGLGLQLFLNNKSNFKPTVELTADAYLADDKVLRLTPAGTIANEFAGMINLFVGSSFQATHNLYISFVAGPSFIGGQTLLGIKPSLGFYFSKSQKWMGKVSYINIFDRSKPGKEDFGSLSIGLGLRLF
jgi:hypothetical protein